MRGREHEGRRGRAAVLGRVRGRGAHVRGPAAAVARARVHGLVLVAAVAVAGERVAASARPAAESEKYKIVIRTVIGKWNKWEITWHRLATVV